MTVLNDWTIEFQADTSKVDAAIRKMERGATRQSAVRSKLELSEHRAKMSRTKAQADNSIKETKRVKKAELSFEGRRTVKRRIERISDKGASLQGALSRNSSPQAAVISSAVAKNTARLTRAQEQLGLVTDKNSASYRRLVANIDRAEKKMMGLSRATKDVNKKLTAQQFAANGAAQSLKNMARSYVSVFAAIAAGASALRVVKDFERVRAVMLLSSDSAAQAKENFQFVSDTAQRLGSSISATADAFAGFNVSAVSAGVSAEESKSIFTDLAVSIQATGLDARQSGLAFLAFKQMMSGPVIQAQEMNQVVEQMPQFIGAARIALKEMGHEGENFKDIIATGTVKSEDFIRTVSKLLRSQAVSTGAAAASQNSLISNQNRMTDAMKKMVDIVFGGGGLKNALSDLFKGMAIAIKDVTPLIKTMVSALSAVVFIVSGVVGAFDSLLKLLGMDSGALGATIILLTGLLLRSLMPALVSVGATAYGTFGSIIAGAMASSTSIWGMVRALFAAKGALRGLLATTGVGLLFVGAGLAAEAVINSSTPSVDEQMKRSQQGSSTDNTNNSQQVNNYISVSTNADAQEIGRRVGDATAWSFSGG